MLHTECKSALACKHGSTLCTHKPSLLLICARKRHLMSDERMCYADQPEAGGSTPHPAALHSTRSNFMATLSNMMYLCTICTRSEAHRSRTPVCMIATAGSCHESCAERPLFRCLWKLCPSCLRPGSANRQSLPTVHSNTRGHSDPIMQVKLSSHERSSACTYGRRHG